MSVFLQCQSIAQLREGIVAQKTAEACAISDRQTHAANAFSDALRGLTSDKLNQRPMNFELIIQALVACMSYKSVEEEIEHFAYSLCRLDVSSLLEGEDFLNLMIYVGTGGRVSHQDQAKVYEFFIQYLSLCIPQALKLLSEEKQVYCSAYVNAMKEGDQATAQGALLHISRLNQLLMSMSGYAGHLPEEEAIKAHIRAEVMNIQACTIAPQAQKNPFYYVAPKGAQATAALQKKAAEHFQNPQQAVAPEGSMENVIVFLGQMQECQVAKDTLAARLDQAFAQLASTFNERGLGRDHYLALQMTPKEQWPQEYATVLQVLEELNTTGLFQMQKELATRIEPACALIQRVNESFLHKGDLQSFADLLDLCQLMYSTHTVALGNICGAFSRRVSKYRITLKDVPNLLAKPTGESAVDWVRAKLAAEAHDVAMACVTLGIQKEISADDLLLLKMKENPGSFQELLGHLKNFLVASQYPAAMLLLQSLQEQFGSEVDEMSSADVLDRIYTTLTKWVKGVESGEPVDVKELELLITQLEMLIQKAVKEHKEEVKATQTAESEEALLAAMSELNLQRTANDLLASAMNALSV